MSRSAPQPATRKTPTGGTRVCENTLEDGIRQCARAKYRDEDEKDCFDHFGDNDMTLVIDFGGGYQ